MFVLDNHSVLEREEVFLTEESVKAGVGLSSFSHEASEGNDVFLSCELSVLIDLNAIILVCYITLIAGLPERSQFGRRRGL